METNTAPLGPQGVAIDRSAIYRMYFHGPAYQVLDRAWWNDGGAIGEMAAGLPPNHEPSEMPLAIAPRLIELCFQTAGIWEMAVQHRMGLPRHVDVLWLRAPEVTTPGPLFAVVTPAASGTSFDIDVVDATGRRYLHVGGYRTVTLREDVDPRLFGPAESALV